MDDRLRRKLLPGSALLEDHHARAPIVPRDIDQRAPVGADGTAACDLCSKRFPLAELDLTYRGHMCGPCKVAAQQRENPVPDNVENLKIGRGRWWLMPLIIAVASVITILEPVAVFVLVIVVAMFVFRLLVRRGL